MKEALCSKVGTVTGERRGREKGKQAAFATAPIYCDVGCRAAVLLHVMPCAGLCKSAEHVGVRSFQIRNLTVPQSVGP